MYTLICTTDPYPEYAVIHLPTCSWGPCDDTSNWFDSIAKAISITFNSNKPFEPEDPNNQIHMSNFSSAEDYCAALCAYSNYVSPTVICHFESPDNFFDQFPELLL